MTSDNEKNEPREDEVLLDLSTVAPPKKHVTIDGERYTLADRVSLGLVAMNRFTRLQADVYRFEDIDPEDLTDEQIEATAGALDSLVRIALPDAPKALLAKLPVLDKLQLIRVFTTAVYGYGQELQAEAKTLEAQTAKSTGAKSSRGSSGSTGSRRRSSSGKRRPRSSKP